MNAIFLGDNFSLDEHGYFGRAFANRGLVKSLFLAKNISHILAITDAALFEALNLSTQIKEKLLILKSLKDVNESFGKYNVKAIICSDFASNYPNWIHYRNLRRLGCPVFGFTHSISYQRFTSSIYQILCARPQEYDAILCTSECAMDVMKKLFKNVRQTINFQANPPSLIHFPLAYEAEDNPVPTVKSKSFFQVLYLGRLDWQTKADILVLTCIIKDLPSDHKIRFIVAGNVENDLYLKLLKQYLVPLGVELCLSVSEEKKQQLYRESHVLFSPSDNYQETFGISLLEAKHYGCVPMVTDFNGYRNLIDDGYDGFLLKTIAAPIPESLFLSQNIVSEATYHGWWAAGVGFDPLEAARIFYSLSKDSERWGKMSEAAMQSVLQYHISAVAEKFVQLIDSIECFQPQVSDYQYPYQWNFTEIFKSYPCDFWQNQEVFLTDTGKQYLIEPHILPQLMLLSGSINVEDIREFLFLVKRGHSIHECLRHEVEPVVMTLSLKNGLISLYSIGGGKYEDTYI